MKQFRALIFDLDGVIVDTEPLHTEAKRVTFQKYGMRVPEDLYAEFRGRTDQDMVEQVVREFADSALTVAEVLDYKHSVFSALYEQVTPIAGSLEFIQLAHRHFEQLALTTSATKKDQQFAFEKFNLQPFFDVIVTVEEISQTKPHPAPYLATVAKLGLNSEDCLVIEDSKNGIRSAKDAVCAVVAIATSFSREQLQETPADYIVESFAELATLLGFKADALL